ncbi:MAG: inositol-3-phosphate synthase [Aestuariivirga sp.]|uniref:inositol-3-phosphate synthase n=1 Tax=Aestuariivirga sp. TaxID=2650926 RepID=UPI0038D059DE
MIRTAIVGVGNCASSLVQAIHYCRANPTSAIGVPFPKLGPYGPGDIEIVAAFDIDARKVGRDLSEAVFAPPNCTAVFNANVPRMNVQVARGPNLDGMTSFMGNQAPLRSFVSSPAPELSSAEAVSVLKAAGAQVVISFLPVGSQQASEFYAGCALEAGAAFVNAIPVFLASNAKWAAAFRQRGLPILGDDFKAQIGATIVHRTLAHLFDLRGAVLDRSYQLNVGGNTDFLNMMDHDRLIHKRESKTEAVQSVLDNRLADENVRIGPSDYVPWLNDQKVGYVRLEGRLLGGVPMSIEVRLSVEDSPNAAAMALSAIRCARIALDRRLSGAIWEASAFLFKHPPRQVPDEQAHRLLLDFAEGKL